MKTKIQEKYIYEGLGFPIELNHVEMVKIRGAWAPKINVKKVADEAIKEIPLQKTRLTGGQIHFIRSYFDMSYREFASRVVHQSHMAVSKWEKFGDEPTNMDAATEVVLRLYIFHEVAAKKPSLVKNFLKAYERISTMEFKNSKMTAMSL
jgi:DNA-binding transcriptional regulator YiaG